MSCNVYLLFFLLLYTSAEVNGQPVNSADIEHYTTKSGLPNNAVLHTFQDRRGFLWIGTFDGLARYDGHSFRTYRKEISSGEYSWISSVDIIEEDLQNNLWIGTRGGIGRYNRVTRKWKYNSNDTLHSTSCLREGLNGNMWFGTMLGYVGLLSRDSLSIIKIKKLAGSIRSITKYDNQNLLVLANNTYILNISTGQLTPQSKMTDDSLYQYRIANNKKIISITYNGHVTLQNINNNHIHTVYKDDDIDRYKFCKLFVSGDSLFFVVTKNTIKQFSSDGTLQYIFSINNNKLIPDNTIINHISKDNTSLIWISTNNGLIKINREQQLFRKYYSFAEENHIKYNHVRCIEADSNNIWVGTRYGQIGRIEFDTTIQHITNQEWYKINGIDLYTTNVLKVSHNGTLWAGCQDGVYFLDMSLNTFKSVSNRNTGSKITEVWAIEEDTLHRIWIGTRQCGLFVINTNKTTTRHYGVDTTTPQKLSIWSIYKSKNGQMWIGTSNGLYLAQNTSNGSLKFYKNDITGKVPGQHVWSVVEDDKYNLWVGTTDKGLTRISLLTEQAEHFDVKNGLVSNTICAVKMDAQKRIWISTSRGISRYDTNTNQFINYNEEDGLISNDYNFKAVAETYDGSLFWGSKIGIVGFKPQHLLLNDNYKKKLVVSSAIVSGREMGAYAEDTGKIKLTSKDNNISFKFAILNFRKPRSHRYRYLLKNFETKWHEAEAENPTAVYTNLQPGNYTFVLQGGTDGREWIEPPVEVHINVIPTLWQTKWFRVAIISLMITIVVLIVYKRFQFVVSREREKSIIDRKITELEMSALRAQMNPHFIFNAITSIQHFIISNNVIVANEYLSKFARLIRLFLESSRNKYIKLEDEIKLLTFYIELEKLRFEKKFDYTISEIGGNSISSAQIPTMIIQPLVENAIIHGLIHLTDRAGHLTISFKEENHLLECIIDDNGIGRAKSSELKNKNKQEHNSISTSIIKERIHAYGHLNNKITLYIIDKLDEQKTSLGTKVVLILPLIKDIDIA